MTNNIEIWKIIEEWPHYSISNFGNIKNNKNDNIKSLRKSGKYFNVTLYTTTKAEVFSVHRLVAKYFIENPKPNEYNIVDHIDGNGYNNNYNNLRWCNHQLNQLNRKKTNNKCSSTYKGVYYDNGKWDRKKRWTAYITFNKKTIRLGRFNTEEEAKEAYNKKALELFGEFAKLN